MLATFVVRVAPVKHHGADVVYVGQASTLDVRSSRAAPHRVQYHWKSSTKRLLKADKRIEKAYIKEKKNRDRLEW